MFTNDVDYIMSRTQLIPNQKTTTNAQGQTVPEKFDPKKAFIDELRARVDSYFAIVVRNVRDSVPKAIGFFLVKHA